MAPNKQKILDADHFSPDTLEFIRLLASHNVRYVIVGGEAVIYHGHARFTGDVDFFYGAELDNAAALYAALSEFWAGDIPGIHSVAELQQPGYVIQFGRPPNRIDLMASIDGVSFDDAWDSREQVSIAEKSVHVWMLSLPMLTKNKRACARPKDLDDLSFLERRAK